MGRLGRTFEHRPEFGQTIRDIAGLLTKPLAGDHEVAGVGQSWSLLLKQTSPHSRWQA